MIIYTWILILLGSRGSSVSIVSGYELDDWFDPRQRRRTFPLASASRPALGPSQPFVQWVSAVLSSEVKRGRGVTLPPTPIQCHGREWVELYLLSPLRLYRGVVGLLYIFTHSTIPSLAVHLAEAHGTPVENHCSKAPWFWILSLFFCHSERSSYPKRHVTKMYRGSGE
jgi:hypothetical protein